MVTLLAISISGVQSVSAQSGSDDKLTLEEAMLARKANGLPYGVRASAAGNFAAWIDRGNIRIADAPDFEPRILVNKDANRSPEAIYLAPDGKTILYIVDQSKNCIAEAVQPPGLDKPADATSQQSGEPGCDSDNKPALWEVDVNSGQQKRVATGADVPKGNIANSYFGSRSAPDLTFSPDGNAFAFSDGNILYEFRRDQQRKWRRSRLTQKEPKNMGATDIDSVTYSPDGKKIAFVSSRRAGQTYIGIHKISSQETVYIDPSIYRDISPVWSPNSKEVAFIRTPGNWPMAYRFTQMREGAPWSLVVANADSGEHRTIWKADRGPGSAYEPFSPGFAPIWTPKDEILFGWEKTGWHLIYAVPSNGGKARLLTPGKGEITNPILSKDGNTVFFEWNKGDLARKHIWSVALTNGAEPVAVTSGEGVEVRPTTIGNDQLAYLARYRGDKPATVMIRNADGSTRPLQMLKGYEQKILAAVWNKFASSTVEYISAKDGVSSSHIFIEPSTPPPPGGYPVVVQAHGGPTYQTLPGSGRFFLGQYLASRGYVYVSMNYRGGLGFGLDYRTPPKTGGNGGSETLDIAAVAAHLKSRDDVNPKKIGIMGTSYGGHIVGQAMSRLSKDFAAGVSQVGVADWVLELKKDTEEQGWESQPTRYTRLSERLRIEDLAHASSPTSMVDRWRGPILFTLGELDRAGHVESAIDLGYRLLEQGVEVEVYIDPTAGHSLFAAPEIVDFFERHLR